MTRREILARTACGFGMAALTGIMEGAETNPLAPKAPPLPAKARSVIYLHMHGGVSHVDTFDPKPELTKYTGKPLSADLDLDVLGADVDRALDRFNTSLFDKDFNDMRKRCRGFTKEWRELSSPPNGVFPDSCAGWCRACGSSLVRGRIQRKPPCVLIVMYRPWIRSVDPRRVRISAWTAESSASISHQPTPESRRHSGEHSRR